MHAETAAWCDSADAGQGQLWRTSRRKLPFAGYSVGNRRSLKRLSGTIHRSSPRRAQVEPQAAQDPGKAYPGTRMPVVIGSGSHPFPFRTRKLSLIPPMVLRAKVRGRVGRCRHYYAKRAHRVKPAGFFHVRGCACQRSLPTAPPHADRPFHCSPMFRPSAVRYCFTRSLRCVFAELMNRTVPNMGRSGHGRS